MPQALATTALQVGGNVLASKLSGGGSSGSSSTSGGLPISPFTGGGLTFRLNGDGVPVIHSATGENTRVNALEALKSSLLQQAGDIRGIFAPGIASAFGEGIGGIQGLLDQVNPGFGALTNARLNTLRDRGAASRSDLRSNLARRRVLGSSFASDVQNRQEQQLSRDLAEAKAVSFLEELDVTNKLLTQKTALSIDAAESAKSLALEAFSAERGAAQVDLDEQNTQLAVITQLISGATAQIGANSRLEAQLAAQSAQGSGFGAGNLFGLVGDAFSQGFGGSGFNGIGQSLGSLFSSSPTGPFRPFG